MGHKLLLADDSITIQKVVGIIFSGEEYDLTVVDNGTDALERAREAVPDVMLIDALMPGKNGYDVCLEARKDPLLSAVPILLLTGVFEPFDETKARESGADDFIAKPFESQVLINKVKELISLGAVRSAAPPVVPVVSPPVPPVPEPARVAPHEAAADTLAAAMAAAAAAVSLQVAPPSSPVIPTVAVASSEEEEILEIEEVSSLDDLWGMELVEEEQQGEIPFGTVIAQQEGESLEGVEELEPFVIDEEPPVQPVAYDFTATPERSGEEIAFDTDQPLPVTVPEPEDSTVEEVVFDLEPDEILPLTEEPEEEEAISFVEPVVVVEPVAVSAPPPAVEEPLPVVEPVEVVVPEPVVALTPPVIQEPTPVVPVAPQTAAEGSVSISEEQLVAALSKVSREVIERIVWEVVPDLAEALIKEEIRKIRESV